MGRSTLIRDWKLVSRGIILGSSRGPLVVGELFRRLSVMVFSLVFRIYTTHLSCSSSLLISVLLVQRLVIYIYYIFRSKKNLMYVWYYSAYVRITVNILTLVSNNLLIVIY
jgi:hypothetical protein